MIVVGVIVFVVAVVVVLVAEAVVVPGVFDIVRNATTFGADVDLFLCVDVVMLVACVDAGGGDDSADGSKNYNR